MKKKHLFAGEMVQLQEAINRCSLKIDQLGNDQPEQLSQIQENFHKLRERLSQVLKEYDSCTE